MGCLSYSLWLYDPSHELSFDQNYRQVVTGQKVRFLTIFTYHLIFDFNLEWLMDFNLIHFCLMFFFFWSSFLTNTKNTNLLCAWIHCFCMLKCTRSLVKVWCNWYQFQIYKKDKIFEMYVCMYVWQYMDNKGITIHFIKKGQINLNPRWSVLLILLGYYLVRRFLTVAQILLNKMIFPW